MPCEGCYNVETTPCGTTGCLETTNSNCILYNGGDLKCDPLGAVVIEDGLTLNEVIENLHTRICELTPDGQDWSIFDYACLREDGSLNDVGASNIGTAAEFAFAVSTALCTLNTSITDIETWRDASSITNSCFTSVPGVDTFANWIQWVVTNVCSIRTFLLAADTALDGRISDLETPAITPGCTSLISGTSTLSEILDDLISRACTLKTRLDDFDNASYTCISGAADNQTLETTITHIQTKICSLDADLDTALAGTNTLSLTYTACLTSAAGGTGSYSDSVVDHLNNIISKAGKSYTFGTGLSTLTVGCSTTVTIDPTYVFACSMLNDCDLDSMNDVVNYSDATLNGYTNTVIPTWDSGETQKDSSAGAWKAKELEFTSADTTVDITVTPAANKVTVDFSIPASVASKKTITANSPTSIFSAVFATASTSFGVYVKEGIATVDAIFDITNATWTSRSWLTLGTVAAGGYSSIDKYIQAIIINNISPGYASHATIARVTSAGVLEVFNPTNASIAPVAPDTFSVSVAGQSFVI